MREECWIGGTWRAGEGERFTAVNPADGATVWEGAGASAHQVAAACAAARAAFPAWARTPLEDRIAVVQRFATEVEGKAEQLAQTITREMGKALWDSRGELQAVVGKVALSIRAQAERAGRSQTPTPFGQMQLDHRPHGVMAVLGPFNFPAHLPNGHIVPALLAGDTIVFKPSELTPGVGALMAQAWEAAGLPPGVLNLVQGAGDVGAALVADRELNGVLFTGSAQAGAAIHRQFAGRPEVLLALEMGGNAPLVVWPPCDAAAAANLIVHSAFLTTGQRCSCARRLILPEGAFGDSVVEALTAVMAGLRIAPGAADPEPFMGPLVREAAAARAMAAQAARIEAGANALRPMQRDGAFLTAGLLDVTQAPAPDEEVFAPLLHVSRAGSFEAALSLANATRFGLAAGLISDEPTYWAQAAATLRAGVLNWNRPTTGASGALPFGGPGLSGNLRPSACYAADYCAYPVASQTAAQAQKLPAPGLPL